MVVTVLGVMANVKLLSRLTVDCVIGRKRRTRRAGQLRGNSSSERHASKHELYGGGKDSVQGKNERWRIRKLMGIMMHQVAHPSVSRTWRRDETMGPGSCAVAFTAVRWIRLVLGRGCLDSV